MLLLLRGHLPLLRRHALESAPPARRVLRWRLLAAGVGAAGNDRIIRRNPDEPQHRTTCVSRIRPSKISDSFDQERREGGGGGEDLCSVLDAAFGA